jgi:trehalose 6-phosphate phosphatase
MTTVPSAVPTELEDALVTLASADRLLVALDFDGTLAPFVDEPGEARVLPEAARAIAELEVLPQTWVAYVSGRPIEGLERVIPADDLAFLVGSHGVEVRFGRDGRDLGLTPSERTTLHRLGDALAREVDRFAGARFESKPVGFGVHTRLLDAEQASALRAAAYQAAESIPGRFTVRDGKDILEFAIRDATKGDGIERMRAHVGATAVFFAGDDVTDEDAFAVLRGQDVGVKVGAGETLARYRVESPADVARLLTALADARSRRARPARSTAEA